MSMKHRSGSGATSQESACGSSMLPRSGCKVPAQNGRVWTAARPSPESACQCCLLPSGRRMALHALMGRGCSAWRILGAAVRLNAS
eukprot:8398362-Alexandrium_andersonii.AAC.1